MPSPHGGDPYEAGPHEAIPYGRDQIALLWIFMAVTAVEIAAVELLVPWTALRLILLVLGIYGLAFMAGSIAVNRTRPHILTRNTLFLRCGLLAEIAIPVEQIASASAGLSGAEYGPVISGDSLSFGVGGSTRLTVTLRTPTTLCVGKVTGSIRVIRVAADEAPAAARSIRAALKDEASAP